MPPGSWRSRPCSVSGLIAPATSAAFAQFGGTSSDGSAVFFNTDEQLVSADTDASLDVYKRSGGTTTWISRGQVNGNGALDAIFEGASSDGSKVFFTTEEQLVSGDTDSSCDIYERSGGTTTLVSQGQINGNGAFVAALRWRLERRLEVFFYDREQLVSGDTDSVQDVYERSGGTTTQVSQGADQRQRRLRRPLPRRLERRLEGLLR